MSLFSHTWTLKDGDVLRSLHIQNELDRIADFFNGQIDADNLKDGGITAAKLAAAAVTASAIASAAINTDHLGAGVVTQEKLSTSPPAVGTNQIADNAVTPAKIDGTAQILRGTYGSYIGDDAIARDIVVSPGFRPFMVFVIRQVRPPVMAIKIEGMGSYSWGVRHDGTQVVLNWWDNIITQFLINGFRTGSARVYVNKADATYFYAALGLVA